jgi:hypothetical protein
LCLSGCLVPPPPVSQASLDESAEVCRWLLQNHEFPRQGGRGLPAVYSSSHPALNVISIYGVVSNSEQDRIAVLLRNHLAVHDWRPIQLEFFESEVLIVQGSMTSRGEERLVRTIRIEHPTAQ